MFQGAVGIIGLVGPLGFKGPPVSFDLVFHF